MATTDQLEWAEVATGTVTNVCVASPAVAQARGWLGPITAVTSKPGIGWTTADNGTTWTAPAPSSVISTPPLETAVATLQTQVATLETKVTTIQSNITTIQQATGVKPIGPAPVIHDAEENHA